MTVIDSPIYRFTMFNKMYSFGENDGISAKKMLTSEIFD